MFLLAPKHVLAETNQNSTEVKIPSMAMAPTMDVGDVAVVSLTQYESQNPERNDIVMFSLPDGPNGRDIKRIIALPGDVIELRGKQLFINYNEVQEPFAKYVKGGVRSYSREAVPENSYFLMGDNRDQSKDSRYYRSPFVPREHILGKVISHRPYVPPPKGGRPVDQVREVASALMFAEEHYYVGKKQYFSCKNEQCEKFSGFGSKGALLRTLDGYSIEVKAVDNGENYLIRVWNAERSPKAWKIDSREFASPVSEPLP